MPQIQILPANPSFSSQLGEKLGSGVGAGLSRTIADRLGEFQKQSELKNTADIFRKQGYPEDLARLAAAATTGGQTQVLKHLLDLRARGNLPESSDSQRGQDESGSRFLEERTQEIPDQEEEFSLSDKEESGLTPRERVQRESERYKTGLPVYQEGIAKLKGFARDKERINILDSLNKSEKLPENFGRLNVDKSGNLRLPFAASPEAQRYVKTLNEFSSGAKDTFGARVTNFDLQQYLQRFPTLLNSAQGRKQLLQQMKIVNEINSVYYKNLKNIYDKSGGVRKIDADVAQSLAERKSEKETENLARKFDEIGQFASLPSAAEFAGKKIRDKSTGEILQSDGKNWIPVE